MEKVCTFSIIIPVYNVEKYIKKCLQSLKDQTFEDFEALIVNDESKDGSLSIINEFANSDNRFKVINKKNEGPGIARNAALKDIKGKYVLFVDPDDYINPETLQLLKEQFDKTNAQVIQFDYRKVYENSIKAELSTLKNVNDNSFYNYNSFKNKDLSNYRLMVWDKAYKSDFIRDNKIEFAPNYHAEDHIFSLKTLFLADKIFYINKYFYNYLTRMNSSSNKKSSNNFCIFDNIKLIQEFLDENKFSYKFNKEFSLYKTTVLKWHYNAISDEDKQPYLNKCQEVLSKKDYQGLYKKIKNRDRTFIEQIFSVKNKTDNTIKTKIVTIFGFEFILKKGVKIGT